MKSAKIAGSGVKGLSTFIVLTLLALACGRPAFAEEASSKPPPRVIHVSGTAKVSVPPDRARLSVSVVTRAKTAREAAQLNAKDSDAVLKALQKAVAGKGEVSTGGYGLDAEYEYKKSSISNRRTLIGYRCSNTVSIVTSDLDQVGPLIDAAVARGANEVRSLQFFIADDEAVRRRATLAAGARALAEADTVAESLGVGRGALLHASTEYMRPPVVYKGRAMAMAESGGAPTPVVPGSLDVSATVVAEFAIR